MMIEKLRILKSNLWLLFFVMIFTSYGQEVDTIEYNGESYFVYPFKIDVDVHMDYYEAFKKKKSNFKREMRRLEKSLSSGDFEDYKEIEQMFAELEYGYMGFEGSSRKYINKKFKKAVRANPYPLLTQRYSLEQDVIPALDPIPDGKYVQLFEDFCLVDENGECQTLTDKVAGIFTIRDNALHGEAYWFNLKGDTLKQGTFDNGLKVGKWYLERRKAEYTIREWDAESYIETGSPFVDTMISIYHYANGAKTGLYQYYNRSEFPVEEGHYTEGKPSGEWIFRYIQYEYLNDEDEYKSRIRKNDKVMKRYTYAGPEDTINVKHPWIRSGLIDYYSMDGEFNFMYEYRPYNLPGDLFEVAFEQEEDLDLEEEEFGSYEFDSYDYGYDDYYPESDYYGGYMGSRNQPTVFDPVNKEYINRAKAIDSLGMVAQYKGLMEQYYPNGQLMYSYEFKDGKLLEESTIFWDNGNAFDVIEFVPDSNHYLRSVYDYDGKLYKSMSYDSIGDYKRLEYYFDNSQYVILDGFKARYYEWRDSYVYDVEDTLEHELSEPLVLYRTWSVEDSSLMSNYAFDPVKREMTGEQYSVLQTRKYEMERSFSEDFESWTGKSRRVYGPLEMKNTASGTWIEGWEKDTIPQRNANYPYRRFSVAEDYVLYKNGEEYTGEVQLNFGKSKHSISKNGLTINFKAAPAKDKKLQKEEEKMLKKIEKYKASGKGADDPVLGYINITEADRNFSSMIYTDFFKETIGGFFDYPDGGYYDDFGLYSDDSKKLSRVEGYMLNGKPSGVWKGYGKKNDVLIEVPYVNGEVQGQVKYFAFQKPEEALLYYEMQNEFLRDSLPEKTTYYLNGTVDYKNDKMDGASTWYDWLGEVTSRTEYKEGYKHGEEIERNKLAFTRSRYQDGYLDGYVQTYLTLPGKDSILLYDLNFQEGNLQGESKSYHLNGNLSKRGFFLNGDPIEDYEAHDSLGFRYHYVKFKYSFPVEEKIWEENQLSVRYQFDWEDSISFVPSDITMSSSLERMLIRLGFGSDYVQRPYYGRPSLVDKDDIRYHMTKYYPNDTVARDGWLDDGKKTGHWEFFDYDGDLLYKVDYQDSIIALNDSIKFRSKGIYYEMTPAGDTLYTAHIIEKFEKYDCSHTDHYEIRQFWTISETSDTLNRMNGYVRNFYDNGTIQSEGQLKDGLPTGAWKFYDPFGKLNQYGYYVMGKRNGRWLSGDLSKTKYLGDICLNPNLPDLEDEIKYRENLLDIMITNYKLGKSLNRQYYDVNMNRFLDVEDEAEEDEYRFYKGEE